MKRISIAAAMLIVMGSVAYGRNYYGYDSIRHRVRWSVYAHSLVPGELHYSPYANKYGSTGLVPYWVRYSPYAYSYKHPSGLVDDLASSISTIYYKPENYTYSDFSGPGNLSVRCSRDVDDDVHLPSRQQNSYEVRLQTLKTRERTLEQLRQQRSKIAATDGKDIIAQYLSGRKIDFRMTRLLQVEGRTISVDFLVADGNILIKYWNPLEILALEYKADYKKKAYEDYFESWKSLCAQFRGGGGKVYQIISSDRNEISAELAKLISKPKGGLDPDEGKKTYALNQDDNAVISAQ